MKIAIAMRKYAQDSDHTDAPPASSPRCSDPGCFAEFEVHSENEAHGAGDDDTVQVTVVLRGKRGELENPALGMTDLVLRAMQARTSSGNDEKAVIDAPGIAVEPMRAAS